MIDPSAQFELQVLPNGRSAADEYLHQGAIWIEGRESSKYVLKFTNRSPNRVNVIFSVDGLDTIKGQPAGPRSEGYVVNANDSLEVPGWMLDDKTAAEFYFSKAGRSYVAASGNATSNTGVIGAMVFREETYVYSPYTYVSSGIYPTWSGSLVTSGDTGIAGGIYNALPMNTIAAGVAGSSPLNGTSVTNGGMYTATSTTSATVASVQQMQASASMAQSKLATKSVMRSVPLVEQEVGTGFGNATDFSTTQIQFNRAHDTVPDAILAVYYNTAKNLQKMGINIKTTRTRYDNSSAQAFPAYQTGCTPPPDWKP